ncbi:MAG: Hpt domain-containing protein [Rhodospirillales bacterium]|nr:Hpt domain-containing protein [Rhodospirillales bacterium]
MTAGGFDFSKLDNILDQFQAEFIEDAGDNLTEVGELLVSWQNGERDGESTLSEIRRSAHSIKGMGGTFGFPTISIIAHRLEDYLSDSKSLSGAHARDTQKFLDSMQGILDAGAEPSQADIKGILRRLPAKWSPDFNQQAGHVEVLVAINSDVLRKAVEREFFSLGYRMVSAGSGLEALQFAVNMRPDAVIISAVMDDLWGTDVARALSAMEATAHIPVGLLTSFDDDRLGKLPPSVVIIHKGKDFANGLADLAGVIKVTQDRP